MKRDSEVDTYIDGLKGDVKARVEELRALIFDAVPNVEEVFKWSRPCYSLENRFCYLQACAKHVNIGFDRGVELDDSDGLLEGTGKGMRHVKVPLTGSVPAAVRGFITRAAKL